MAEEGPGLRWLSQGDPPRRELERGTLVQGDIFCPLAPTPETKRAVAPGGSRRLSLKLGKSARCAHPLPRRARLPKGWS